SKQVSILGLLLLHANRVVSRDRLIDELWDGSPPETASTALQVHVSGLRKSLGREAISTQAPGYKVIVLPGGLDLDLFEALVAKARSEDAERSAELLREALDLWRGPALADLDDSIGRAERAQLEEERAFGGRAARRRRARARAVHGAPARARGADARGSPPRASPCPADAGALPLGPPGRGARGLPQRSEAPGPRTRPRARRGVAAAGEGDSRARPVDRAAAGRPAESPRGEAQAAAAELAGGGRARRATPRRSRRRRGRP